MVNITSVQDLASQQPCAFVDPVSRCSILGVGQVAAQIKNTAVVVHGPKGCVYPIYEATLQNNFPYNYTEMCENNVVFGNEEVIRDKILDTYYDNAPSLIVVVTTCSSEIIGDDVDGVIYSLKDEVTCPIVKIEGVGFKKNHIESVPHAMSVLLDRLSTPSCCAAKSAYQINLIPHIGTTARWKDEVHQIKALLTNEGYSVNVLFCDSDYAELSQAGEAALNVSLNGVVGESVAVFLNEKYGTPYIASDLPIGLENTVKFLNSIDAFFGVERREQHDQLADVYRKKFRDSLGKMANLNPLERAQKFDSVIIGDIEQVKSYLRACCYELGITPCLAIIKSDEPCLPHLSDIMSEYGECRFVVTNDNLKIKAELETLKPELIFSNDFEYLLCKEYSKPNYINISYPGARYVRMREEYHVGFSGALILAEQIINSVIETRL